MANVLVLGATGQVGIALTVASLANGHNVTGVSRSPIDKKPALLHGILNMMPFTHEQLDIFVPQNYKRMRDLFSKHDIVFHAAEPYPFNRSDVAQAIINNARLIRTTLDAEFTTNHDNKKRFIRIGSPPAETDTFGIPLTKNPFPGIPYFDAKWAMSREAQRARDIDNAAIISVVLPAAFGPASCHGPLEIFPRFINGEIPIIPSIITNAAPVWHLARGALLAAEKGSPGRTYQLAGMDIDTAEIIKHAKKCAGVKGIRRWTPTLRIFPTFLRGAAIALRGLSHLNLPPEFNSTSFALLAAMGKRSYNLAVEELGYVPPTQADLLNAISAQVLWYQDAGLIKSYSNAS